MSNARCALIIQSILVMSLLLGALFHGHINGFVIRAQCDRLAQKDDATKVVSYFKYILIILHEIVLG